MSVQEFQGQCLKAVSKELAADGLDEASVAALLGRASSGISISEGTPVFETLQLDEFGRGKSTSLKYALSLRLGKTLEAVGTLGLAVPTVVAMPWLAAFAFLLLARQMKDCTSMPVSRNAGIIAWVMWKIREGAKSAQVQPDLTFSNILAAQRRELKQRSLTPLPEGEVWLALKELSVLGIVDTILVNRQF